MNYSVSKKQINKYLIIGGVWTLLWLIHYMITYPDTFWPRVLNETWRSIYIISVNIVFYEYAFPYWKSRSLIWKIIFGFLICVVLIAAMSLGIYAWREAGVLSGIYTPFRPVSEGIKEGIEFQTPAGITSIIFFGVGIHIFNYFELQKTTQRLKIEKQEAELAFLKSQTNPHFLFNTLNNIYSLAKDKAPLAGDSILRLSGIMRYMLYQGNQPTISIKQEIELLNDYLELEKLRYGNFLQLDFTYKVHSMQQQIPPLLLVPLVENAFKHGVSQSVQNAFLKIDLSVTEQLFCFTVVNSMPDEDATNIPIENIGLTNLRKQLSLLYSDYELKAEPKNGNFNAQLTINLEQHA